MVNTVPLSLDKSLTITMSYINKFKTLMLWLKSTMRIVATNAYLVMSNVRMTILIDALPMKIAASINI